MNDFFIYIRRDRKKILAEHGDALAFCRKLLTGREHVSLPERIANIYAAADPDERDYAIASAYSLLIGEKRRQQLSAYFTPPVLSRAVMEASAHVLDRCDYPVVLDPACGGGSFITPVVRHLVSKSVARGFSVEDACRTALKSVHGIEIDSGLATLSQSLLRNMLAREYGFKVRGLLGVVRCADALNEPSGNLFDLIVGNPPYGKIGTKRAAALLPDVGSVNIGGHTNLYALFLVRSLGWLKPGGELVFIVPTSFVAGPYFAGLREEVLKRAEVVRIDIHEERENLFLGVLQDICVLVLRRRATGVAETDQAYELGVIDNLGTRREAGAAIARVSGQPWTLPVAHEVRLLMSAKMDPEAVETRAYTLADYGYRVRVGKVVPTRERKRLHRIRKNGDLPLLWASTIRPDGSFDFAAPDRFGNARWYSPPNVETMQYNTMRPSLVLQRTSNRDQVRRLNAAAVPAKFRNTHKTGFVAENHVIVIEALRKKPLIAPRKVARLLNSAVVNERFSAVCGSFSISAKLLQCLALPEPPFVAKLKESEFEHRLRAQFAEMKEILVLDTPRDAEHAIDKAPDLRSSTAVNEDAGLKRRAVA
jgi:adenine-specific DNA-methyltransferase